MLKYYIPNDDNEAISLFRDFKNLVLGGDYDPLDIYVQIKVMEQITSDLFNVFKNDPDILDAVIRERDKYSTEKVVKYGRIVSIGEVGVSYKYDDCNDSVLESLLKHQDVLESKIKERKKFLNSITEPVINPDTGELLYPSVKKSKTSLIIKKTNEK